MGFFLRLFLFNFNIVKLSCKVLNNYQSFEEIYKTVRTQYYLRNKKVPARLHLYLRLESTNHQEIGEITSPSNLQEIYANRISLAQCIQKVS